MTAVMPPRLFYVDDSGSRDSGYVVYSWIECTLPNWCAGLRSWLELRETLAEAYGIAPSTELHATTLVTGRGLPSTDRAVNTSRRTRQLVAERALATIGRSADFQVGTVYRRILRDATRYPSVRDAVYVKLISYLNDRLRTRSEYGMIFMDGNDTAPSYCSAHRELKLGQRHIIEDPMFMPSHRSQWIQMADLVAWTAYQSLARHPNKQFAWDWYDSHLKDRDVNGGPVAL